MFGISCRILGLWTSMGTYKYISTAHACIQYYLRKSDHISSVVVVWYTYSIDNNCLKGVFTLMCYVYVIGFLWHDHFPGHCVDRQVHHDLHWEGILSVDRQRSESNLRQTAICISAAIMIVLSIYRWTIDLCADASGTQHLCYSFTLWQIHCLCRYV